MSSGHLNIDFKIRLPQELKDKIRQSSEQYNRTMTADIVARLEYSFEHEQKAPLENIKANYFSQKLYGLIYMANMLESRINNTEYVLKHTDDPKQVERYNILLDICQHDLENIKNNIENSLNAINNENFTINQELAIQTATILNKKTTS